MRKDRKAGAAWEGGRKTFEPKRKRKRNVLFLQKVKEIQRERKAQIRSNRGKPKF